MCMYVCVCVCETDIHKLFTHCLLYVINDIHPINTDSLPVDAVYRLLVVWVFMAY